MTDPATASEEPHVAAARAGTDRLPATTRWRLADSDWDSWPAGLTDRQTWDQAAGLGLAGVELGVYDAAVGLAPARLEALEEHVHRTGVQVAGVLLSLPGQRWPGGALTGDLPRLLEQVRACAQACRRLGLGVLGLWPGADLPGAEHAVLVAALRQVVEVAGEVRVALEYKPGTALPDAATTRALCAEVPGLGVLLDTGHAFALGEDPARVVADLGELLLHVHLGDAGPGGGDDDLPCGRRHDFTSVVAALDASYAGWASFDLHGAVSDGVPVLDAVRESRDHLLGCRP